MSKIENIIEYCNDCQYCTQYTHEDKHLPDKIYSIFLCEHADIEYVMVANPVSSEKDIDIPEFCPLETYSPRKS